MSGGGAGVGRRAPQGCLDYRSGVGGQGAAPTTPDRQSSRRRRREWTGGRLNALPAVIVLTAASGQRREAILPALQAQQDLGVQF